MLPSVVVPQNLGTSHINSTGKIKDKIPGKMCINVKIIFYFNKISTKYKQASYIIEIRL